MKGPFDKRRHDDEKYCCKGMPLDVKRPPDKRRPLDKRRPPAPSDGGDIVKRASASSPRSKLKSNTMDLKGTGRKKKRDERRHDDEKYCCKGMPLDVKRPPDKRRPDKRRRDEKQKRRDEKKKRDAGA